MARFMIRFLTGSIRNAEYSIGPNQGLFFGAGKDNHVRITDDPSIGDRHARMWQSRQGKVYFEDLDSAAGCRINGKRVTHVVRLKEGDRVNLGETVTFQCDWWDEFAHSRIYSAVSKVLQRSNTQRQPRTRLSTTWIILVMLQFAVVVLLALVSYLQPTWLREIADHWRTNSTSANPVTPASVSTSDRTAMSETILTDVYIWDEVIAISTRFGEPPPAVMDSEFIDEIRRWIKSYSNRAHLGPILKRQAEVWPTITGILRRQGLPSELAYVAWVESALVPTAQSHAGAAGLWQFMPTTARSHMLKVSRKNGVDERLDVSKSTVAAAKYIHYLLDLFGPEHYLLAIASYNLGQNRMKREQVASIVGESSNAGFWALRKNLPTETQQYVPRFLAAAILGRSLGMSASAKK